MAVSDRPMRHGRRGPRPIVKGIVAAACLFMAACSTNGGPFEGIFGDAPLPPKCPSARILQDADSITIFADGPGRDLTDVVSEARVVDFFARCLYDVDDETGEGEVAIELSVMIEAARGPANTDGDTEVLYFASITDNDRNVLSKSVFKMTIRFAKNAFKVVKRDEPLLLRIPLKPPQKGDQFIIFMGLQLTPEEYEYNKKNQPALLGG